MLVPVFRPLYFNNVDLPLRLKKREFLNTLIPRVYHQLRFPSGERDFSHSCCVQTLQSPSTLQANG